MNKDAAPQPIEFATLEEKIERWGGWDETTWRPDWMKVYGRVVSFAAGGAAVGAGHALATGRAALPNALAFAGYTTIVSGIYYASREAIFGREIERFRQEALALALPESQARDYPWRIDVLCGGIAGGVFGALARQSRKWILIGATVFGSAALAFRIASSTMSDFVLPHLLPDEQSALNRAKMLRVLPPEDVDRIEEEEGKKKAKPWALRQLPEWSPVKAITVDEREKQVKDKEYDDWLSKEVEDTRVSVAIKRRLRQLELERLEQENPELASNLRKVPTQVPTESQNPTPDSSKQL